MSTITRLHRAVHCGPAALVALLFVGCQGEAPARRTVDSPPLRSEPVASSQAAPPQAVPPQAVPPAQAAQETDPFTPRRARDGRLRIAHEAIHDNPSAAAELFRRLDEGGSSELRVALVEALPLTGGPWSGQALVRMAAEPDAAVRRMWVTNMVRAEPSVAVRGMALGLGDDEALVRKEAALIAASLPTATLAEGGFDTLLADALGDADAAVRAGAARSLGILGFGDRFDEIASLLADADVDVRLQALRALGRLDRTAAKSLPAAAKLRDDADARLAAEASRLLD